MATAFAPGSSEVHDEGLRALARRWVRRVDWWLLGASLAAALLGIAFIQSAEAGADELARRTVKQAIFLLVGLGVVVACVRVPTKTWMKLAPWLWAASLVGLLAVFVLGHEAGGQRNWIRVGGLSVQPSEIAKVATVLLVARIAAAMPRPRLRFRDVLAFGFAVGIPMAIVAVQDEGTAATFAPLLAVALFASGLRWRWVVVGLLAAAVLAPVAWGQLADYQRKRFEVVVDPYVDASGVGYHPIQARIAIGSGGITGRGWGEGPQNRLGFLPERHTDYIFAVVAEEWGFAGAVVLLALFLLILRRLVETAAAAKDRGGAFLCLGALTFLGVHVVINVGMVVGLLPTVGIPLPFVSYGGSALLASFAMVGLALGVRAHGGKATTESAR